MILRRRRRLPERLEAPWRAFEVAVSALERAKAALTEAVPGARAPGRPLADALLEFEDGLRDVRTGMRAWRAHEVDAEWRAASAALDEALSLAERVRTRGAEPQGFEGLIAVVGELLAPLEAFEPAAERFRSLRA